MPCDARGKLHSITTDSSRLAAHYYHQGCFLISEEWVRFEPTSLFTIASLGRDYNFLLKSVATRPMAGSAVTLSTTRLS